MKYTHYWPLVLVALIAALLGAADVLSGVRRDKFLLDHKCRLVSQAGDQADHLYECDTGLMRLRDIG